MEQIEPATNEKDILSLEWPWDLSHGFIDGLELLSMSKSELVSTILITKGDYYNAEERVKLEALSWRELIAMLLRLRRKIVFH